MIVVDEVLRLHVRPTCEVDDLTDTRMSPTELAEHGPVPRRGRLERLSSRHIAFRGV